MLASLDHKYVLLMNPKTGSTSFNKTLRNYANIKVGGSAKFKHISYVEYREIFGDFFYRNGCDVFIVVREPLEVLKSWYRFRYDLKRYSELEMKRRTKAKKPKDKSDKTTVGMTFQEFMGEWSKPEQIPVAKIDCGINFCLDIRGNIPSDITFIRYEELQKLADILSEKTGRKLVIPKLNVSPPIPDELLRLDNEEIYLKLAKAREIYVRIPFA
ncbi:MAG: sulfotransferase family 2 domain-containing protein [Rhodobacteraceae bacterium]|nr:sulfotransferase family 2 domain-containing protein [Paracoccaceae bacterium]